MTHAPSPYRDRCGRIDRDSGDGVQGQFQRPHAHAREVNAPIVDAAAGLMNTIEQFILKAFLLVYMAVKLAKILWGEIFG